MASLLSQFGAALLAVQEGIRRSVEVEHSIPRAGNLVVVELDRETFFLEQGSIEQKGIERFRKETEREVETFLASNEWALTGPLSVHVLLRSLDAPCYVRVKHCATFYSLLVRDDKGERIVPIGWTKTIVGREHDSPPRAFLPVFDSSRSLSREHLMLTFEDLELRVHLMGKNPTTLNDRLLASGEIPVLEVGDVVRCGPYSLQVDAVFQ